MALKIGIVSEYYYPLLGGITENVYNTRVRLQERGHEVKIITANCDGTRFAVHRSQDFTDANVIRIGRSLPIYSNSSFGRFTAGRQLRAKMKGILERERFDLLHLHSPVTSSLPAVALLEAKCALVGTFHSYFDWNLVYSVFKGFIQKKGINRLDGKIGVSQSSIDALRRYFDLEARIIPNGVDTTQFSPAAPRLEKFSDGKRNLLFLGRFDPRNGLALMLRAFAITKAEFPDVRLIVVGDGTFRNYYRRLVPKEVAQDVHFAGPVRDERPAYYATCDVFCSPVTKASFGITLLEAMAAGKPIVATDNIGYREVLSPEEGFCVPPDDPALFARAILRLLRDENLRQEMGANGRKKALRYSWDKVAGDIAGYYAEILKTR